MGVEAMLEVNWTQVFMSSVVLDMLCGPGPVKLFSGKH